MDLEMRFSPAVNPETGLEPAGTVEVVRATTPLVEMAPGVWAHTGSSELDWDSQQARRDKQGRIQLIDPTGSTWWASVEVLP